MAEEIYRPFVEINGIRFVRGGALIVGWKSRLRSAQIVDIKENLNGIYFTANVSLGDANYRGVNPLEYVDTGFSHLSNPGSGNKCVHPDEGEEACAALNAFLTGRTIGGVDPRQIDTNNPGGGLVGEGKAEKGEDTAPLPEEETFDPADRNRDGLVSEKEREKERRKHDRNG